MAKLQFKLYNLHQNDNSQTLFFSNDSDKKAKHKNKWNNKICENFKYLYVFRWYSNDDFF